MNLFLISTAVFVLGAFVSLLLGKSPQAAKVAGSLFGMAGAGLATAAGILAIIGPGERLSAATPFAFAEFALLLNPLSGLLLLVINLLALLAFIYGLSYLDEYKSKGLGSIGFFMNIFVVAMNYVITSDNAFWFLVFFEMMSLSSYFLVIVEQDERSTKAGFLYLVMAHIGFLLIMISFFVMASQTGSFDFNDFRQTPFGPVVASLVFVLAFLGFGIKAGMVPFHSWLPEAHPAAPSHVSAMMSGGMIKIGVFGIIKVGLDLLASSECLLWWGILIVLAGAVSAVLGIVYAFAEHDIKRLLAYSSVENIGIIFLGVGMGFIGVATEQPLLAALGLAAGLFHLLNHAIFKGLLFFGAGSLLYATGTRNIEKMGGLIRVMPITAACFLVGALAISAIPPLNGFVSEWFLYQAMIGAATEGGAMIQILMAVGIVCLAITGALAAACFVKAYGISFLGTSRLGAEREVREVPAPMRSAMLALVAACVCLGIGAPWVVPLLQQVAAAIVSGPALVLSEGIDLVSPLAANAVSTPLLALALGVALVFVFLMKKLLAKGGTALDRDPWACGYLPEPEMPMLAVSFEATVNTFLAPLYNLRAAIARQSRHFVALFQSTVRGTILVEPLGDRWLVDAPSRFIVWLGRQVQRIEGGNYRVYLGYIVAVLVLFLLLTVFVG